MDGPQVTAEPERAVEQPGPGGPVEDEDTPDPNRADEEPATPEPGNDQTQETPAASDQMSSELGNIHFPFDQKLFTDEGRFSWNSGDWKLPSNAVIRGPSGQAAIQCECVSPLENFLRRFPV